MPDFNLKQNGSYCIGKAVMPGSIILLFDFMAVQPGLYQASEGFFLSLRSLTISLRAYPSLPQ
jgi:hypothetical protein